ncbi:hypothetical protein [Xanthovirga aplysinae]|uniref:hypothetical protein n=1 Tax=Xanthovirga aplysinae TaxID=2529853 RepID=UPI0012BC2496|nr:hypothetical protein [Xanthovirga aplysinae]MTI32955.1 hypothetical protein [Xanthovirga aplysinae]
MNTWGQIISLLGFLTMIPDLKAQDTTMLEAVKQGNWSGQVRSMFLATDNVDNLKDFNAWAIGGKLKFKTADFKGFKFGASFYTTNNLGISDLGKRDPQSGRGSRYESGLFDMENVDNRQVNLLGELYLMYDVKKHHLVLGRFIFDTPLVNPQDGRMIPTLVQGVDYQYDLSGKGKFYLAYLHGIAPRSVSRFYKVSESIGVNSQGQQENGEPGNYKGNLSSMGMAVTGFQYKWNSYFRTRVWNYFVENIFNTTYAESFFTLQPSLTKWEIGFQHIYQFKIGEGGNSDPTKSYYTNDNGLNIFGVRFLTSRKDLHLSVNYNFISDQGRFLFPRSWGVEPLFTFQRLERQEGSGKAQAVLLQLIKEWSPKKSNQFKLVTGVGRYWKSDVTKLQFNKYALPTYDQIDFDFYWIHKKKISLEYLFVYKFAIGNTYEQAAYILNKVDMTSHNLVLNYNF